MLDVVGQRLMKILEGPRALFIHFDHILDHPNVSVWMLLELQELCCATNLQVVEQESKA